MTTVSTNGKTADKNKHDAKHGSATPAVSTPAASTPAVASPPVATTPAAGSAAGSVQLPPAGSQTAPNTPAPLTKEEKKALITDYVDAAAALIAAQVDLDTAITAVVKNIGAKVIMVNGSPIRFGYSGKGKTYYATPMTFDAENFD